MAGIQLQILHIFEKALDKLIGGLYGLEAVKRDRILHPGIMSVKGDDIVHSHTHHFLKRQSTVQRFPCGALMLTAFVEIRHDHGDPPCLSSHRSDNSFEILIMIVRRHMVFVPAQGIGQTVICHIHKQVKIGSADGFQDNALGLPGAEAGHLCL